MQFMDIKNGRFYLGDCLEVMKEIPDGVVDMILCDLPYGTTQNKWDSIIPFDELWKQYWRIIKPNGAIVLTAAQPFTSALVMSAIDNFKYNWTWQKGKPTGHLNAKKQPMRETEDICVFYKHQCTYNPQNTIPTNKQVKRTNRGNYGNCSKETTQTVTGYPTTIISFKSETGFHPTQKPVELFEYLIKTYTNEGELVLDNCAGSGTTAIAAENCGRKWVCIEQLEEYANKAVERILNHTPEVKSDSTIQIENDIPIPEGEEDGN
jgi:site-specific DNA-methyltransferase (adenine-specific)